MKKAICFGINNYPGTANDLSGCVNDALDWGDLLERIYGFEVETVLDNQVTGDNFLDKIEDALQESTVEDVLVVTYSGHGTNVRDRNGDEPDGYDEALYLYDGVLLDDEIRQLIDANLKDGVNFTLITDSCFSGTVSRFVYSPLTKPRFVLLAESTAIADNRFLETEDMPEMLLTGCSDNEYSYDAYINGRWNGAMTRMAIDTIKENPEVTYEEFFIKLREKLPTNQYPQSPQLEGATDFKNIKLFEKLPEIEPEPIPEPDTQTWLVLLIRAILELLVKLFGGT